MAMDAVMSIWFTASGSLLIGYITLTFRRRDMPRWSRSSSLMQTSRKLTWCCILSSFIWAMWRLKPGCSSSVAPSDRGSGSGRAAGLDLGSSCGSVNWISTSGLAVSSVIFVGVRPTSVPGEGCAPRVCETSALSPPRSVVACRSDPFGGSS